jgi:putative hydrolase of the HAD superfamily
VIRHASPLRALIVDWGGVMTAPIGDTVRAWLDAEGIDPRRYADVMRPWVAAYAPDGDRNPIHALERGECPVEEFERELAARLARRDGGPVPAPGLVARMFAATAPCQPMYRAVAAARRAGLRTGLLSNSWGTGGYPREEFPRLFDAVVISAEVGMRKPEERIYRHAAGLLGVDPAACVFVDDLPANVAGAQAAGMTGVLYTGPEQALARLAGLLKVVLG